MKRYTKCECGGTLKKTKVEIMPSVMSEAYKCGKCGEVEFTEEQMRTALRKKEKAIKIMVKRKLGEVGGSLVLRIPKSVENQMKLKPGKEVRVIAEKNKIIVEPV